MKKNFVFILISVLFLFSCSRYDKKLDNYIKSFSVQTINQIQLAHILYLPDTTHFILVDVRSPYDYSMSHIPGAINIPLKHLATKKKFKEFQKSYDKKFGDKILVVYGANGSDAQIFCSILKSAGFNNLVAVPSSYENLEKNFVERFGIFTGQYYDERPLFNYKDKFAELSKSPQTITQQKPKKLNIAVPVKKKEVGGGCE